MTDNFDSGIMAESAAIMELLNRTKYTLHQVNGQRIYGAPWHQDPPEKGCEVFVGKVPRDMYEDELVPLFESIGTIYELRLMMDFSGTNRGYAFVKFTSCTDAKAAVLKLNNYQVRKGWHLGVVLSDDNDRLFIGGIPRQKTKDELHNEINKMVVGIDDIILYPSLQNKLENRGYAFVIFENHHKAARARRLLLNNGLQLWGHKMTVDWAEPEPRVDNEIMSTVRVLYVRNIMLCTTEDTLQFMFSKAGGSDDCVHRVKKTNDYAFIHFKTREAAMLALEITNGTTIDGSVIQVTLAKPVLNKQLTPNKKNSFSVRYKKSVLCRSPITDNTVYRPIQGRSLSLTSSDDVNRSRSTSVSAGSNYSVERLQELCLQMGWGFPQYKLLTVEQNDTTYYVYKVEVIIDGVSSTFTPDSLTYDINEAKITAANYSLRQLNVNGASRPQLTWPLSPATLSPGAYSLPPSSPYPVSYEDNLAALQLSSPTPPTTPINSTLQTYNAFANMY